MIKVNAVGQTCPIPIIMTKNALKDIEEGEVEVLVDNKISLENLQKMSKEMGYDYSIAETGEVFRIVINKIKEEVEEFDDEDNTVVVISSDRMGTGNDELGKVLIKGFIFAVTQLDKLPKTMLFYNGGATLTTEGSDSLEDLKSLEAQGVEIMTCGTCLDYYGLKDKLAVGSVTNMYSIVETQAKATKIIKP